MTNQLPSASPIRLVLFDVGGVLISLHGVEEAFPLRKALARAEDRERFVRDFYAFRDSDVFDRFERGRITMPDFFDAVRDRFALENVSDADLEHTYNGILGEEIAGMGALIDDAKRAGLRVAGLSDISQPHLRSLHVYPSVMALERVIASCETGRRKPDPETFRDALRRLGARPEETFFTDDTPANVAGAREAGLRAEVFAGPEAMRERLGL